MHERTRTRRPKMCARTYRQRPRLGLVIRRLHLADDVPARVLRGGAVEGVRGELQVFRLLSELERVESAVARKRTVEPRRAVTERERDLRRIARVFSSVDPDRSTRTPIAKLNRPRASLARTHRVQIGARGATARRLFRRRLLRRSLRRGLRARHRLLRRRRRLLHRRGLLGRRLHREAQSGDDRGGAVPSGGSIEGS